MGDDTGPVALPYVPCLVERELLKRFNAFPFFRSSAVIICACGVCVRVCVYVFSISPKRERLQSSEGDEFQSVAWIIERFRSKLHRFSPTMDLIFLLFFSSLCSISICRTIQWEWYSCTRNTSRRGDLWCYRIRWRRSRDPGRCFWRRGLTSIRWRMKRISISWNCGIWMWSCRKVTRVCTGVKSSSWMTSSKSIIWFGWVHFELRKEQISESKNANVFLI